MIKYAGQVWWLSMVTEYGDQVWSLSIMIKYDNKKRGGKRKCEKVKNEKNKMTRWKGSKGGKVRGWQGEKVWWLRYDD